MTTEEIERLRTATYAAQDYMMGAICDLAITGAFNPDDYTTLSRRESDLVSRMSREHAIRECIRAFEAVR